MRGRDMRSWGDEYNMREMDWRDMFLIEGGFGYEGGEEDVLMSGKEDWGGGWICKRLMEGERLGGVGGEIE